MVFINSIYIVEHLLCAGHCPPPRNTEGNSAKSLPSGSLQSSAGDRKETDRGSGTPGVLSPVKKNKRGRGIEVIG